MAKPISLKLTQLEFAALWQAALSIGDDLDAYLPEPKDQAAYRRMIGKLRRAWAHERGMAAQRESV